MPIFEFKCDKCGKEFERVVFVSDQDKVNCPDCGSLEARKLLSVFSCSRATEASSGSCGTGSSGFS